MTTLSQKFSRLVGAFTLSFIAVTGQSLGQTRCDPNAILRQNVTQYNSNLAVWMSYINNLAKDSTEDKSSNVGISYAGIGLTYADAKSMSEYINQYQNYQVSAQQTISVLRSTLDPDSVRAYLGCIKAPEPVTILMPESAVSDAVFQFTVIWNPDYRGVKASQLSVNVTGGTIDGKKKKTVRVIPPKDSPPFELEREDNGNKPLYISAYVDGMSSDIVSLPAFPQFVVKFRQVSSAAINIERGQEAGDVGVSEKLCITPTNDDSRLLPNTITWIGTIVGNTARAFVDVARYKSSNNSLLVCAQYQNSSGGKPEVNKIIGKFVATEVYSELKPK